MLANLLDGARTKSQLQNIFGDPISASGGEANFNRYEMFHLPLINHQFNRTEECRQVRLVNTV